MGSRRRAAIVLSALVALLVSVGVAVASGPPAKAANTAHASAHPRHPRRRHSVSVRFTAPVASGPTDSARYSVSAKRGNGTSATCTAYPYVTVTSPTAGARLTATLKPSTGGRWCKGVFHGTVEEITSSTCPPAQPLCPATVTRAQEIGTFRFRVR